MSDFDADEMKPASHNPLKRSLSSRLLALTLLFVLLAELVVMIPSVARQRVGWLNDRIEAAYLVGLALDAPGQQRIDPEMAEQLFATANILGVTIDYDGARMLIMSPGADAAPPTQFVDLRTSIAPGMIADAWATVFSTGDKTIRVVGEARYADDSLVDILVSQAALRRDLLGYARNILLLSMVISLFTAGLVYWTLNHMIVTPVKRLTRNMMAFEANPEDSRNLLRASNRRDEIGVAERTLSAMELRIQSLLAERKRLAALGAGISKISHDLRNILASAQLMSDRLAKSDDPRVRKLSPRLVSALDRAVVLSRDTLSYARMDRESLNKGPVDLHQLVEEVFEDCAAMTIEFQNNIDDGLTVVADKTQLYRALFNLVRNSVEALEIEPAPSNEDMSGEDESVGSASREAAKKKQISVDVRQDGDELCLIISDNGPGVPEKARDHLFEPFKGSFKPGGTGLGMAIAHEIARAHGGRLSLMSSGPDGAVFEFALPHPQTPKENHQSAAKNAAKTTATG